MVTTRYKHPALKQLADQQKRYAPIDKRLEQMDRAERVLSELDPQKEYKYQELCEKVTTFRSQMYPDLRVDGGDAIHDLRQFVEDLSSSVNLPVEKAGETVFTVDDLSEKFRVSSKTVDRWRKRGLVARKFKFGKRVRVGFLRSSVDQFVRTNETVIQRGSQFHQITDEERADIILKARHLTVGGAGPTDISRKLAVAFNRSAEAIRTTLKDYDRDHPENALFPDASSPLGRPQRQEIRRQFQKGVAADDLAKEFSRTKASIYRIVLEERAANVFEQTLDFMDSPAFHVPHAEEVMLGLPPEVDKKGGKIKPPPGLPPYLASLYAIPLLTREEEGYYFGKMNYLKFRARELRQSIDRQHPRLRDLEQVEKWMEQALEVKNFLIRSNLRLVVSIAKRHMSPANSFFEMVSDGNMSLIRAIEKFDYTKGNKFSTYSSWAIMKNFARSIPAEHTIHDRFRTGNEEIFMQSSDQRGSEFEDQRVNLRQREAIMSILDQLDERERRIIVLRFGLDPGTEPLTLEEVGSVEQVTKERIRQIESRTLQKIRKLAKDSHLEIPGL